MGAKKIGDTFESIAYFFQQFKMSISSLKTQKQPSIFQIIQRLG